MLTASPVPGVSTISTLGREELDRRLAGPGLVLRTGAFSTRIHTRIGHLADAIALLYADYPVEAPTAFADFQVRLHRPAGPRHWLKPQVRFDSDGREPFAPLPLAQAYPMFEWVMNWCVSSRAHGYLVIHAAVLERGGRALIMPAPPGSGKSTLCAALAMRGWRLLSDELALLRPEDLQAVWKDLDMPSGHAYAKGLRTVKTCVGSEWCRFGTQDSTQMGKDLERGLFKMYAPHKVKLAVSGCPRNCAESGIKDVGVIGVDSGWEIYVGGNGGIKTEVAQFLCRVKTSDEVMAVSGAFLQLYRKEGWYLERTVHYLERVGLDHVKAKVIDDVANRDALWAELQAALAIEEDPWHKPKEAQVDLRQFIPIKLAEVV